MVKIKDLNILSQEIASIYSKNIKVQSVMQAGSVARNLNDAFSDIELYVLWNTPPTDHDREEVIEKFNGRILSYHPFEDEEWAEAYEINGIKIEVSSFLTSTIEKFIRQVIEEGDIDIDKQCILSSIRDGIPLAGEISQYKESVRMYPDGLKEEMIRSQLYLSSRWSARYAYIQRNDLYIFKKMASGIIEQVLRILHGLNGMYVVHPGFKWLSYTLKRMEIKPENLEERIYKVLFSPTLESIKVLEGILFETIELVKKHFPLIDISEFLAEADFKRGISI